jgi:hypothetical protein
MNNKKYIIKHKFHAKKVEIDDISFPSKKEATRYKQLKTLQEEGVVLFFLRQVPLHLPGGVKYVCDFLVFLADGNVRFEDVKGFKTETYKIKKKIVEDVYPIEIFEI